MRVGTVAEVGTPLLMALSPPALWLPGVLPFFRLAALAAGVCVFLSVCFPFPISRFQEIENP